LIDSLTYWINHELGDETKRIRVEDLESDLYDGLVLKELMEKLSGQSILMPGGEFAQAEERQRNNVKAVLSKINDILALEKEYIL